MFVVAGSRIDARFQPLQHIFAPVSDAPRPQADKWRAVTAATANLSPLFGHPKLGGELRRVEEVIWIPVDAAFNEVRCATVEVVRNRADVLSLPIAECGLRPSAQFAGRRCLRLQIGLRPHNKPFPVRE